MSNPNQQPQASGQKSPATQRNARSASTSLLVEQTLLNQSQKSPPTTPITTTSDGMTPPTGKLSSENANQKLAPSSTSASSSSPTNTTNPANRISPSISSPSRPNTTTSSTTSKTTTSATSTVVTTSQQQQRLIKLKKHASFASPASSTPLVVAPDKSLSTRSSVSSIRQLTSPIHKSQQQPITTNVTNKPQRASIFTLSAPTSSNISTSTNTNTNTTTTTKSKLVSKNSDNLISSLSPANNQQPTSQPSLTKSTTTTTATTSNTLGSLSGLRSALVSSYVSHRQSSNESTSSKRGTRSSPSPCPSETTSLGAKAKKTSGKKLGPTIGLGGLRRRRTTAGSESHPDRDPKKKQHKGNNQPKIKRKNFSSNIDSESDSDDLSNDDDTSNTDDDDSHDSSSGDEDEEDDSEEESDDETTDEDLFREDFSAASTTTSSTQNSLSLVERIQQRINQQRHDYYNHHEHDLKRSFSGSGQNTSYHPHHQHLARNSQPNILKESSRSSYGSPPNGVGNFTQTELDSDGLEVTDIDSVRLDQDQGYQYLLQCIQADEEAERVAENLKAAATTTTITSKRADRMEGDDEVDEDEIDCEYTEEMLEQLRKNSQQSDIMNDKLELDKINRRLSDSIKLTGQHFGLESAITNNKTSEQQQPVVIAERKSSLAVRSPGGGGGLHATVNRMASDPERDLLLKVKRKSDFAWYPPNLSLDQTRDFFRQFPLEKVPLKGSSGAIYREEQIARQLPKQDISAHYCNYLDKNGADKDGLRAYQEFVNMRNIGALDVAHLIEINQVNQLSSQFQRMQSFGGQATLPTQQQQLPTSAEQQALDFRKSSIISQTSLIDCAKSQVTTNIMANYKCRRCLVRIEDGQLAVVAPKFLIGITTSLLSCSSAVAPSPSCLTGPSLHQPLPSTGLATPSNSPLSPTPTPTPPSSSLASANLQSPPSRIKSIGSVAGLSNVDTGSRTISLQSTYQQQQKLIPTSSNALTCQSPGSVQLTTNAASATTTGQSMSQYSQVGLFHPKCFTCSTCKEFLVDLVYCIKDNKLYCMRHYGESIRPRCGFCEELIFSDEYSKAMSEDFHVDHFMCRHCNSNLAGNRYVLKDEQPYCTGCYESQFANQCEDCHKPIGIDSRDLSYKDKHWHDSCFICHKCNQSLIDKPFGSKSDHIYCADCYDSNFATRCDGCSNPFRAGSKKMEYRGRQWHDSCFCCCVCKNTIGSSSFIPKNDEMYCIKCYEDKYATRCTKCKQVIVSGGVTFRNEPWHRECFNCCNCNKSLAGQRFTTREEKNQNQEPGTNKTNQPHNAYCIDCYGELFAKRCFACSQAITGMGGTKFVTFEDRNWHNDCFICTDCQTSLVGKGFITDGPDAILCGDCARAKLRS